MTGEPRLPYRPPPLEDEPLDGWFAHIAAVTGDTRASIMQRLDLPGRESFVAHRDLSRSGVVALSEALSIPEDQLLRMTSLRWQALGLRSGSEQRGTQTRTLARSRGLRVCPQCLVERDGRLKMHWYLLWSFACVRHARMLVPIRDSCFTPLAVKQEVMAATLDRARHDRHTGRLSPNHSVLGTQARLDEVLNNPDQPVMSLGEWRRPWEHLADTGALVRLLVASDAFGSLTEMAERATSASAEWVPLVAGLRVPQDRRASSRLASVTRQPVLMGLAATVAGRVMHGASRAESLQALWWLSTTAREEAVHHARDRQLTWPLVRILDSTRERDRPFRQLLLRFGLTCYDAGGLRRAPLDPATVPAACWGTVTSLRQLAPPDIGEVAASAALITVGSNHGLHASLQRVGHEHLFDRVRRDWRSSFGDEDDGYFQALVELHDELTRGAVPIDYGRRRRTFPVPEDIGPRVMRQTATALDRPLTKRLEHFAAWYVWELLTGSNVLLSPRMLDLWGAHRLHYRRQRARWNEDRPSCLMRIAEQELLKRRIDEPVYWAPVRLAPGWMLPPDDQPRLLAEWSRTRRPMRGGVRPPPGSIGGYSLGDAVAVALHQRTETGRRMARNLIRFRAVVEEGSIRAAGTRLGVTAGTLSVQIRDLECDLGVTLFDRAHGSVRPTATGHQLLGLIVIHESLRVGALASITAGRPRPTHKLVRSRPQ